jgi:hypothetical protein
VIERFPVEEGHIRIFAEAIGDPDPAYRVVPDPDGTTVLVAPPTFAICAAHFDPEFPLRPKIGRPWPSTAAGDSEPIGVGGQATGTVLGPVLHAAQQFDLERPLIAGDVLSARTRPARTWTKQGRQGLLHFTEIVTEHRDATGALVVTARSVTVRTETKRGGPA